MSELLERLLARDATLWPEGNVSADRLGWLDLGPLRELAWEAARFASGVDAVRVVLLGMGGSSLGPEVLRAARQSDRLVVLDTTDPATVAGVDLEGAFFLVSSKSGGTLEVQALLAHCWDRVPDASRYAAITDPGTALAQLAGERGYRTLLNPPDIGGRYSVLSLFGLVPAALVGIDPVEIVERAARVDLEEAVELGVHVGTAAAEGRDKLTVRVPPTLRAFGLWVEQLVAESLGKRGRGCIPVPTLDAEDGPDRAGVAVHVGDPLDLGAEFYRWEVATAVAAHVLAVDPFDEPNVAESKRNTARVLDDLPLPEPSPGGEASAADLGGWLKEQWRDGDYVSLQAYLPYGQDDLLDRIRRRLRDELGGAPVTAGYGPRFLHSTGQLHKGGPDSLLAVQIVPRHATADLPVPGFGYDFGTLIAAQALGDLRSLEDHGRRVLRIVVDDLGELA